MKKLKQHTKNGILVLVIFITGTLLTGMSKKPPLVGGPVPHFQLQTLNGSSAKISDYRGKVILLNFWASWCTPCKAEMPEIQAAYEAFKDQDFVVLGINFGEKPKDAKKLVKEMGLTFPILLDRKVEVAEKHNVVSLPVTFFIDPNGIIKERLFGGTLTKKDIEAAIQRLQVKKG